MDVAGGTLETLGMASNSVPCRRYALTETYHRQTDPSKSTVISIQSVCTRMEIPAGSCTAPMDPSPNSSLYLTAINPIPFLALSQAFLNF